MPAPTHQTTNASGGRFGSLSSVARRRLPVVHFLIDAVLWAFAIPLGVWVRYDFQASFVGPGLVSAITLAVCLQGAIGFVFGQYRRKWRYGSFDEVRVISATAGLAGVILSIALWWNLSIPRSVPMLAALITLLGQVTARSVWRAYVESRRRPHASGAQKMIVVGAGDASTNIVRTLLSNADSPFLPVALLDDDPNKSNLRISGVAVAGDVSQLGVVAELFDATAVLIAIPSADGEFLRLVDQEARKYGLDVFVLPPVEKLFGTIGVSDIRPISHDDLLGRQPAEIDPVAIAGYISGRTVLVTGAGGSIGGELCRQIVQFEPGALLMLDRDESGLHSTQLSIEGRAMLDSPDLILADIRDAERMEEVFATYRPEIVFHAAALKHLPLLETHPAEGWKTNVLGTLNLLQAADRHGVARFVNVSTDKAANPTSVLGWTKRITERLTAYANSLGEMSCVSVRFGNVLGSNGSVLKTFEAQVAAGVAITVTHPDITRYFMTIQEASRLIVQAGAIGEPGEVMILDMGQPVRIIDVAKRFAEMHDPPLEIVFTGLRPNEKLHEDLISDDEHGVVRSHRLITHVDVPPLTPDDVMRHGAHASIESICAIAISGPIAHPSS